MLLLACLLANACSDTWNNPYPHAEKTRNISYSSFELRPKHLDPAQSYASNEIVFTGQIYEPPLQYHYLKRPYTLTPLTAMEVPQPYYEDQQGRRLEQNVSAERIAYSVYEIRIKAGIRYQPHPAFATDEKGKPLYLHMKVKDIDKIDTLTDFPQSGSRELTAADYVYQIKRLAHPRLHSPIYGLMAEYIVGLREYATQLKQADQAKAGFLDLRQYPLAGVELIDRYTYRIRLHGLYPQFVYWLAMPFFAPVPPEADEFYSQSAMQKKNITLDWFPVGTGPYMLTTNNPNRQMILERNPNFHGEAYPQEGESGDREKGLLNDAGKPLPFIDQVVFSLERESIPTWNKFLQGYYDASGISSDSFDQAIQVSGQGDVGLTSDMQEKKIQLITDVAATSYYMGFNMLDPVVGAYTEQKRKLRQAISIAVDYEEFISIFLNGRGIPAQGPLPPGIFGYHSGEEGVNSYVYDWTNGKLQRKSLEEAKRLLVEAGYPGGRDVKTGKPLILHLDTTGGGPDDKARFDWLRKQFAKINLQLDIRATDYNRFQDKIAKGTAQLFQWGWNADYPDPENFMFLLYGANGRVVHNGENTANYENPEFDRLFQQMKIMPNGPARLDVLKQMTAIVHRDAPWLWGFHPKRFSLFHHWFGNVKLNAMANNTLKYKRLDPQMRNDLRGQWNQPLLWPTGILMLILIAALLPALVIYRRKLTALGSDTGGRS